MSETQVMLTNYHTHTWRCQHARGTEEEYVQEAIRLGYSVLGFADHSAWPYQSDYVSYMRMRLDQFPDYEQTVRSLARKYAEQIDIPLGMESEAFPPYINWLRDFKAERLDYVILGNHYDYCDEFNPNNSLVLNDHGGFYFGFCKRSQEIIRYAERTIWGMRTGVYDYVAHPDLYCFSYPKFDENCASVARDLCAAAEECGLPLEVNLNGMKRETDCAGYPCREFWEIASDYQIQAVIGVDAHSAQDLQCTRNYERAIVMLKELKIPLLSHLDLKKR